MQQGNIMKKPPELQVINTRRNPYLVNYEEDKRRQEAVERERRHLASQRRKGYLQQNKHYKQQKEHYAQQKRHHKFRAKKRKLLRKVIIIVGIILLNVMLFQLIKWVVAGLGINDGAGTVLKEVTESWSNLSEPRIQGLRASAYEKHPEWTEDFLTPNEYSRPGDSLEEVNSVFVHYTANQGTGAAQNRSYFEQLKDTHERSASAHFIIGYEGEIIQCIPLDEIGYAVKTRNYDSISIECCYLEADGSFTQETYDSLILLLQWLVDVYDLEKDDILRHYDCGGKKCPLYYTEHEDAWELLKRDVMEE